MQNGYPPLDQVEQGWEEICTSSSRESRKNANQEASECMLYRKDIEVTMQGENQQVSNLKQKPGIVWFGLVVESKQSDARQKNPWEREQPELLPHEQLPSNLLFGMERTDATS